MPSPAAVLAIQVDANTAQANAALMRTQAQLESTAAKSKAATDAMATQWKAAGTKMTAAGKSMTRYVTLPVVALGAAAIKTSIDFHKSMTLIQTQAGASAKEVDKMSKAILAFAASGNTSFGPNELAQGLYAIESAGIHGAKALQTLKKSSNLAMIGQTDLASTTKALVAAQKTGIKGTQNLNQAIGTLNATVGAGQMHMDDLLSAMGTGFLSAAKGMGLSLTDVGAALAELTKQGMPASAAATRLRMSFSLMAAPSSTAAAALKTIGLNSTDLATTMRGPQGLLGALQMLEAHLQGLSKVQQTQTLSAAFGGGRSSSAIIALLGNLKDLDSTMQSIHKHAGAVNQDLQQAKKTKAEELQIEWAKLQATLVELGDKLIPVVIPALQKLGDAAIRFIDAFNGAPNWVIDLMIGTIAIGPFLRVAGGILKIAAAARAAATAMGLMGGAEATVMAGGDKAVWTSLGTKWGGWLGPAIGAASAAGFLVVFRNQIDDWFHSHGFTLPGQTVPGNAQAPLNDPRGITGAISGFSNAISGGSGTPFKATNLGAYINIISQMAKKGIKKYGDLSTAAQHFGDSAVFAWKENAKSALQEGQISQKQFDLLMKVISGTTKLSGQDMKQMSKITGISMKDIRDAADKTQGSVSKSAQQQGQNVINSAQNTKNKTVAAAQQQAQGVTGAYVKMNKGVATGLGGLATLTNNALKALGVSPVNFNVKTVFPNFQNFPGLSGNKKQKGGQIVPGMGSGDKVPAMLEPGEFVLNREAVKGIGQARLESLNKAIPRFAKGGVVLDPGVNMSVGQEPQILADLRKFAGEENKTVYVISGYRSPAHSVAVGGFANDPHTQGKAADIGLGSPTLASMMSMALDAPLKAAGLYRPFYPPSSAEANHVQLLAGGAKGALVGAAAATWKNIKRVILGGPDGALHSAGQGSLDKVWKAVNAYGRKKASQLAPVSIGGGAFIPGSGSVVKAAGSIIEKAGGSKTTAAAILGNAWQESTWNPHAGNLPGGPGGLWGFTSGDKGPAALAAYANSQKGSMFDTAVQTNFMLRTARGMLGSLNKESMGAATADFMTNWEAPAVATENLPRRLQGAQMALSQLQRGGLIPGFAGGGIVPQERALMEKIWAGAAPYYGKSGHDMPHTLLKNVPFGGALAGELRMDGGKRILWPHWMGKKLLRGDPGAKETLIHEWAHYFQRLKDFKGPYIKDKWEYEGGADAFARYAAPHIYGKLGIPYKNTPQHLYDKDVRRVQATNGRNWIRSGQFKQAGGMVMPPYGGSFANGGVVPGPVGQPRTAIVHGGEKITSAGAQPNVTVNVEHNYAPGMEWLADFIRSEASVEFDERAGLTRQESRMR